MECYPLLRTTFPPQLVEHAADAGDGNVLNKQSCASLYLCGLLNVVGADCGGHTLKRVVELCTTRCCNDTGCSHFTLQYDCNVQTLSSMWTNWSYLRTVSDKCEYRHRSGVLEGEVTAADMWILALMRQHEPDAHCTDELKQLSWPAALHGGTVSQLDMTSIARFAAHYNAARGIHGVWERKHRWKMPAVCCKFIVVNCDCVFSYWIFICNKL